MTSATVSPRSEPGRSQRWSCVAADATSIRRSSARTGSMTRVNRGRTTGAGDVTAPVTTGRRRLACSSCGRGCSDDGLQGAGAGGAGRRMKPWGWVELGPFPSGDCTLGHHGVCVDDEMGACSCSCHPAMSNMCDSAGLFEKYAHAHDLCNWEWCQCPCHYLRTGALFVELRRRVS